MSELLCCDCINQDRYERNYMIRSATTTMNGDALCMLHAQERHKRQDKPRGWRNIITERDLR